MPASALDVLSLEDAKLQLRITENDDNTNAIVTSNIQSAVDYVDQMLLIPIIDRTFEFEVDYPENQKEPIWLSDSFFITSVNSVKYWSKAATALDAPDVTVAAGDLGRQPTYHNRRFNQTFIYKTYPATGGWDAWLASRGTPFIVNVTESLTVVPKGIVQAVITVTRRMHDGYWESSGMPDFKTLIAGYETWLM